MIEVINGGIYTTVQDYPGRVGYWNVGIPPSGPMDAPAFRIANRLVGNGERRVLISHFCNLGKPCVLLQVPSPSWETSALLYNKGIAETLRLAVRETIAFHYVCVFLLRHK